MSEPTATSYDEVPYSSNVFSYSHPDRLATLATLLGMQPAPVGRCRVLELGCGTGSNLLPMAYALQDSRFVGIDLSPKQIAMGQETQQALGLTNLDLRAMSILDVDDSFGLFDYIICHGVYSWVPPDIQDKILTICKRNLAPNGVAYVSYNTYPGWHVRAMIREMMRFHVRQFADPQERIQQAWALLDFLIESVAEKDSTYQKMLQVERDVLASAPPTYLYHEHLEDSNHPIYFYEFVERINAKGLQYLSEARFFPLTHNLTPKVTETLERLAIDVMHGEQYLDFVRNRRFRWSLACHQDVPLKRPASAEAVQTMQITGMVNPVSPNPDLASDANEEFQDVGGDSLTTNNPLFKTALCVLAAVRPAGMPFAELWERTSAQLKGAGAGTGAEAYGDAMVLANTMLQCFLVGMVEIHVHGPRLTTMIREKPRASEVARHAARKENVVPNLRHRMVALQNDFEKQTILLLDGKRDRGEILLGLEKALVDGTLAASQGDRHLRDMPNRQDLLAGFLDATLRRFAGLALLEV